MKKKGFILAYSVILMTFIMFLITAMITMSLVNVKSSRLVLDEFYQKTDVDQIGEYFVSGEYWRLDDERFNEYDVKWYSSGGSKMVLVVRNISSVLLHVETENGKVTYWGYGEKNE